MSDTNSLNRDVQNAKDHAVESFGQLKDDAVRVAQTAAEMGRQGVDQVKAKINDGRDAVRAKISEGTDTVRTKLNEGTEAARAKLNEGTQAARDYANTARERGGDLLGQVQTHIEQNPLQAVAIAAGVGVVLGVLLRRR
ncbi:MAG: hypothetical protein JWM57_1039 [Phycisphaerales bacterium]|nr:hypothetical protein [Phycisphaerales bacterium]